MAQGAGGLVNCGSTIIRWGFAQPAAVWGASKSGYEQPLGSPGAALWRLMKLWAACWAQVGAKVATGGRQKIAKSCCLEPPNGPKRVQRAIKRGTKQQMLKTLKIDDPLNEHDRLAWKGFKFH